MQVTCVITRQAAYNNNKTHLLKNFHTKGNIVKTLWPSIIIATELTSDPHLLQKQNDTATDSSKVTQLAFHLQTKLIIDSRLINLFVVFPVCDVMSKLVGPSLTLVKWLFILSAHIAFHPSPTYNSWPLLGCHFVVLWIQKRQCNFWC